MPLSFELKTNELTFTVSQTVNTTSALIKVIATDGINTAEDISNSTFSMSTLSNKTLQ